MEDDTTESYDTDTTVKLMQLPKLSFMDFWVHDFPPLDISQKEFTNFSIPPLVWMETTTVPSEMTVKNIGHMLNVEAEYSRRRPTLSGSLFRCPYEFWCFHFHCGTKIDDGSEHRLMEKRFPMEIHVVFYNNNFLNTDEALNAKDGILILVTDNENLMLKNVISNLEILKEPGKSNKINPFALSSLFDCNLKNYLMYWGAHGNNQENPILWIISPKLVSINTSQLSRMRSFNKIDYKYFVSNCRSSKSAKRFKLFSVNEPTCTQKSMWRNQNDNVESDFLPDSFGDLAITQKQRKKQQTNVVANMTKVDTLDTHTPAVTTTLVEDKHELNEPVDYTSKVWEKVSNVKKPRIENKNIETDYKELTKSHVIRSIDKFFKELNNDIINNE